MEEKELTPTIELSTDFQERALATANGFLNSPDAAKVKVENFMNSDIENQTILKTIDEASHTAFHIESGYAAGSLDRNAKKTVISWHTLGEDKGDLPNGSIEILESGGERKIIAHKQSHIFFSDEGYLWGGSRDMVGRTTDMKTYNPLQLSKEQASQILARLESSQANKEYTEATAEIMDSENRFVEALVEFQSLNNGNPIEKMLRRPKIESARKKLTEAGLKYEKVEVDIDQKRKKRNETSNEDDEQKEDTQ